MPTVMLIGLTLLTCGPSTPLRANGALCGTGGEEVKDLAHYALSRVWVPNGRFGFSLWYKQ
jgi:hypothetical protein